MVTLMIRVNKASSLFTIKTDHIYLATLKFSKESQKCYLGDKVKFTSVTLVATSGV